MDGVSNKIKRPALRVSIKKRPGLKYLMISSARSTSELAYGMSGVLKRLLRWFIMLNSVQGGLAHTMSKKPGG